MTLEMAKIEDSTYLDILHALHGALDHTGFYLKGDSYNNYTVAGAEYADNTAFVFVRMLDIEGNEFTRYINAPSEREGIEQARQWAEEFYWAGLFQ